MDLPDLLLRFHVDLLSLLLCSRDALFFLLGLRFVGVKESMRTRRLQLGLFYVEDVTSSPSMPEQ
jgi:hypothetical protein